MYNLPGGLDSGQSSIFCKKVVFSQKISSRIKAPWLFWDVLQIGIYSLSYATSGTGSLWSIKSKTCICWRCICDNSSSVLLQVHWWNDISSLSNFPSKVNYSLSPNLLVVLAFLGMHVPKYKWCVETHRESQNDLRFRMERVLNYENGLQQVAYIFGVFETEQKINNFQAFQGNIKLEFCL